MTSTQAKRSWLEQRKDAPSERGSREWSREDPRIRAQSFFSARVADARILAKLREVSDRFSRNEIDQATAQAEISRFLVSEGYDPRNAAISNLASTARINLILRQNAAMAAAVGRYAADTEPENLERWPYWKYHARGDDRTRGSHAAYDGKIFRKTDPIWHRIFPPWEFNCRCWVEEVDEEEAEESGGVSESGDELPPVPESGFEFDPAHAFTEFDLNTIDDAAMRDAVREELELELGDQVILEKPYAMLVEPHVGYQNYSEIGLERCREWKNLPEPPSAIQPEEARERLEKGYPVEAGDGEEVTFGQSVLDHWEIEKNKTSADINGRLSKLDTAIATVKEPFEVWQQDTQKAYIKLFEKPTGGKTGCAVFVQADGTVKTYFPKDANGLDKCRKGILCISFNRKPATGEPAEVEKLLEINRNLVEVRAKLQKLLREAEEKKMPPETVEKIRDLLRQAVSMKYLPGKVDKEN